MHHIGIRNKKVYLFSVCFILIISGINSIKGQTTIYGNFPYKESFSSGLIPSEITVPASGYDPLTGIVNNATFTTKGLQLTENKKDRFGAIFVNNRKFNTENGIVIEFEYAMYGGTDEGADGITFFLFDADFQNPTVGATGAGLGYTYNRSKITIYPRQRKEGLSGAYIGIAFDSFGNFKTRRFQGESLVNGIVWNNYNSQIEGKNHVSIRGAKGVDLGSSSTSNNYYGMDDGYTGYPVLITQPTSGSEASRRRGVKLQDDGTYNTISNYTGNFDLRNGGYTTDPSNSNYRKAIISLFPYESNGVSNGFLVTVKIQHGTEITTVIDNYHYKTSFSYYENAIVSGGDRYDDLFSTTVPMQAKHTLNAATPAFLRFGFSASTGGYNDYHIIRNLEVTLPSSVIANNDVASTTSGIAVNIPALKNDLGYSGPIVQNQVGSSTYLNKSTFRFSKNRTDTNNPYEYTETGVGTWKYNSSTGIVTFTPLSTFVGTATIDYSIKAGINNEMPYADEAYRSTTAKISVEVTKPKNTHVISNRFIQPAIIK